MRSSANKTLQNNTDNSADQVAKVGFPYLFPWNSHLLGNGLAVGFS